MGKTLLAVAAAVALLGTNAFAERIHCRWDPTARPSTYLQFNTKTKRAFTVAGWNDANCLQTGGRYSDSSGNVNRRTRGRIPTPVEPHCRRDYTGVSVYTGLPPYGKKGITLVAFGDVPMASLRLTYNGTNWYEREASYPYEAYYGEFPGNPDREGTRWKTRGVCWTDRIQAVHRDYNN